MKKSYTKKRYLCDQISNCFHKYGQILFILFFLAYIISCILASAFLLTECAEVLAYPESEYEYLNSAIDSIWNKDTKELDFDIAPNDVIIHSIKENDGKITFICQTLLNSYIINPTIFVEVSDDITLTFLDKDEYINKSKSYLISISNMLVLIIELIGLLILDLLLFVVWIISSLHKFIAKKVKHT